jgi:hypothetical protein
MPNDIGTRGAENEKTRVSVLEFCTGGSLSGWSEWDALHGPSKRINDSQPAINEQSIVKIFREQNIAVR